MRTQTRNHDLVYTCNLASASTSYQTISSSKSTWGSRVGSGTSTRTRTRSMAPLSFFYVIFVYFHLFLFLQFQDHQQSQFGSFFALAQTQTQSQYDESVNSRINDWREWNFYQILGLSPIDYYFPRNNKKKNKNSIVYSIPNRKTRRRERASVNSKDIKKAYRKQAQLWHPDKITSRKKQQKQNVNSNGNNNNNNNNNNMDDIHNLTVEECNARFAKIAEAYEVLNDEEKRYGYDTFLLDSEDQMELEERQRQFQYQRQQHNNDSASSSSIFSSFRNNLDNFNPMSVFDDFFFGGSNNNYDGASNSNSGPNRFSMNDLFESFFGEDLYDTPSSSPNRNNHRQQGQNRDTEHQRPHRNQQPDRVNEATQIRYDPRIQQEIIRVLHREEFDEIQYNRIYYRVIAQEFVEEINMYHGGLEYVPISEPYFVEEGYSPLQHQQHQGSNQFGDDGQFYHHNDQDPFTSSSSSSDSKPQQQQKGRRQLKHQTSSRMESYEYITPNTKIHLKSDNGQYYAGLTEECEFVIMQEVQSHSHSDNNEEHEDDVLIWSSGTFLPGQYQGRGCSFAVYAGRVAVVAGDVDQPKAILWNSPLPSLVPGSIVGRDEDSSNNNEEGQLIEYYVSLDDDGSLAVYRTRKHDPSQKNDDYEGGDEEDVDMMTIAAKWWSDLVNGKATIPTKTRAAEMWRSLQKWGNKKLLSKPKKTSSSTSWTPHRRNKTSESRDRKKEKRDECVFATGPAGCLTPGRYVVRISKDIKQILDRVLEDFVDSVSEGSEDDLDYFDTATRVVARSTQYIGDVTMAAIKRNVYAVQLWTSRIRNLIEQLKELWYEAELVNKLHEKIEELKEFLFEVQ